MTALTEPPPSGARNRKFPLPSLSSRLIVAVVTVAGRTA